MDLKDIGRGDIDWIHLNQDTVQCWIVMDKATNEMLGIRPAELLLSSQEGFCSIKLRNFSRSGHRFNLCHMCLAKQLEVFGNRYPSGRKDF
jgi:hypothetical protein